VPEPQRADDLPVTIAAARAELLARRLSAVELVAATMGRVQDRQPELNAYLELQSEAALAAAREADARSEPLPLAGIPICVKDVIDVEGMATTAGSKGWRREPERDATAVARLRAAGAIIVGKGNTNEFAYGIDGRNPHRGDCCNPHDPARISGGSSSGPAAATAAGMALAGLGTDTSGSIRVPASLCGVVGIRPALGAVPTDGVVPLASTYDVVGPLARSVEDAALLLEVLAPGLLDGDLDASPAGVRIGLVDELLDAAAAPIAARLREVAAALEAGGARIAAVDLPLLAESAEFHRVIQCAEGAAAHAGWFDAQRENYAADVRGRLEDGRATSALDYLQAQDTRRDFVARVAAAASAVDLLLAPSTLVVAPPRADATVAIDGGPPIPIREALLPAAVPFSQLGWPAVSVPAGTVDGLPFGAQLVGRPGTESTLLRTAAAIELLNA
jgi:Asp-tRNA(Asn)/Glu-tRNA(Gln) amidotransferase A subunit family amidase